MIGFFELTYLIFYVAAMIGRAPFAFKVKKLKVIKSKRKLIEMLYMIPVGIGLMVLPLVYIFSDWLSPFDAVFPTWVRMLGLIVFASAVFLHNWTHIALKSNWSPFIEIYKTHKLIVSGPYKHVRHPMYTAFWLGALSQGFVLPNYLVIVVGILSFGTMYLLRIKHEEAIMIEQFGDEYKKYMKRTGSLFPKLSK